jgi:hypothetical protein
MLSDHEERRLAEIESALAGDDPAFARRLANDDVDPHRPRRRWTAVAVCAVGLAGTILGLILADVAVAVVAICSVGVAGAIWTWPAATSRTVVGPSWGADAQPPAARRRIE